jgi:hypothetical protein
VAYPDPDRLLVVWSTNPSHGLKQFVASVPDFEDWRKQNHAFEQMAAIQAGSANMTGVQQPERLQVFEGTPNIFSVFGMQPELGRGFVPEDQQEGRRVVVLDYAFWQRSFGGDKNVLSKTITLDGANYTIIGILPKQFFSFGRDIWKPLAFPPNLVNDRGSHAEFVVARLKPQVSFAAAQTEMDTIAKRLEQAYPNTNAGLHVELMVLTELFVGSVRPALLVLFAAVGFCVADRMRQRGESDAGALHRTPARSGRPHRARWQPRPHHPPIAHRKPAARKPRRWRGTIAGRVGHRSPPEVASRIVGTEFRSVAAEHPGARLHTCALVTDRRSIWFGARAPEFEIQSE